MNAILQEYWPLVVIALVLGIIIAWWIFSGGRKTRVETTKGDVLDEGADRASRNEALIKAPTAAEQSAIPTPAVSGLAGAAAGASIDANMKAAAATVDDADDLTQIKGVGPKIADKLKASGVTRFSQIAAWNEQDIAAFSEQLNFTGRIERDRWVEQAAILASGNVAAYEEKFGKI